jgi:methylmalonyl-CoA mutase N-terminal domain/subunit
MVVDIESKGDPAELSDKGWFKRFFDDVSARYAKQIADGELKKVGLNCHQIPDEEDTLLKDVAEARFEPYRERAESIGEYKKSRDQDRIKRALEDVYQKARSEDEDLMAPIITATEQGATMGEIAGMLRTGYDVPYDPHGLVEPPL